MAKDGKFGTFGGVFTPSLLTILGVIMYMRLPWVIGNTGLYAGLAIILVAHIISISTGLSISSIATDKAVGAGGPYYIVSRSLGLPIGGTLGIALFLGLSFSISLYVIGFCESFLEFVKLPADANAIRICGTIVMVVLTTVTLISTAFAIKTQYLILALIALSLVSVFTGGAQAPSEPHLTPSESSEPLAVLFGIFFPAVTGFTAGVNMSGDLKDPKRALPRGTLTAIGAGAVVYVGLAVFLAFRVPADLLVSDTGVLMKVASVAGLVVAGIWGATLSSALGSILGAPRILQALAGDGIMPRFLAKGHGVTREPRRALVIAFLIGEAGVLIAELNVIARVVSMVFLTTYGFLNVCCAIESWASPDFRPTFRIPRWVSVIGAATSILVMIQLDLGAMAAAVVFMGGLFFFLQRRQLRLETGDTWEGVWSSLIRSGLYRLSRQARQQRNWKPNVLLFRGPDASNELLGVGEALVSASGMLTDFVVGTSNRPSRVDRGDVLNQVGVFRARLETDRPWEQIPDVCRYHGFGGVAPNTVLLPFREYTERLDELAQLIRDVAAQDLNLLIYGPPPADDPAAQGRRIDVWWRSGSGHLALSLALVRFLTASKTWQGAEIHFFLVSDDSSNNDILRTTTRRLLREARIEASVRVISNAIDGRRIDPLIQAESAEAGLTLLGLPDDADEIGPEFVRRMAALERDLGAVLFVRGSTAFEKVLRVGREASTSLLPPAGGDDRIEPGRLVDLPETPALAAAVSDFASTLWRLEGSLHENCIARFATAQVDLLRRLRSAAEREMDQLAKAAAGGSSRRFRKGVNRSHSTFLEEVHRHLSEFGATVLEEQNATLEARIAAFAQDDALDPHHWPAMLKVERDRRDFEPEKSDNPAVRRFKRRKRFWGAFGRGPISYKVPEARLRAYYVARFGGEIVDVALKAILTESHQLAVHLGKLLHSSKAALTLLSGEMESGDGERATFVESERAAALAHFDSLIERQRLRVERLHESSGDAISEMLEQYAADLQRFDLAALLKAERKVPETQEELRTRLESYPKKWRVNQKHLVERACLAVDLSMFQHKLAAAVHREREAVELRLRAGAARELQQLGQQLAQVAEQLDQSEGKRVPEAPRFSVAEPDRFEAGDVLDGLATELETCVRDLPDAVTTLTDEAIDQLEEGLREDAEQATLSLRHLVQFLIDVELVGTLRARFAEVPVAEARAIAVAQDAARLLAFQMSELVAEGELTQQDIAQGLVPALENARERVGLELEKIQAAMQTVGDAMREQLEKVLDATNAYEITTSTSTLDQQFRLHRGKKAVSGARGFLRGVAEGARRVMVRSLYRASAGVVMARRLRERAGSDNSTVEQVLRWSMASCPSAKALEQLPFYYRQLFLGQSTPSDNFWVGREVELRVARRASRHHREGVGGALFVVGHRGSGKTSLWQRIGSKVFGDHGMYRVRPPVAGSCDPQVFKRAFETAVGTAGSYQEIFRALDDRSVIVVDDLELWWERSEQGLAVVDVLSGLISQFGKQCFFIVGAGAHAFRFINRLRPLSDGALAVIDCGPLPAERLKEIISLRHASTGLNYELEGANESSLTAWNVARLFSGHFRYSAGFIGPALQSWITHVERATKDTVVVRRAGPQEAEVLDGLRSDQSVLLIQLLLHRRASQRRLGRVTGFSDELLGQVLDSLARMRLVEEPRPRVYEVNRFLAHAVEERLHGRGLL